jgi:hypothetical protein
VTSSEGQVSLLWALPALLFRIGIDQRPDHPLKRDLRAPGAHLKNTTERWDRLNVTFTLSWGSISRVTAGNPRRF